MADNILEVNDGDFEQDVMQSHKPVLVDFWAPWCGPCRAIGPVIEELALNYSDKVNFKKCNVDDNPVTPGKFGIKSIPTLIFFNGGKVAEQIVGIVPKSKLEEILQRMI
jgi:thioredoxin 1